MKRAEKQSDFLLSIFRHPLSVRALRDCSQVTHIALLRSPPHWQIITIGDSSKYSNHRKDEKSN